MLKDKVFLTSTDTTTGFVSQNSDRLNEIKQRPKDKKFIKALNSFDTLKSITRIPIMHKKRVRRAEKSTFIIKDESFRVVKDKCHLLLLDRLKWAYSTSANPSGRGYDEDFAYKNADIIVVPLRQNGQASSLFKLGKRKIKRLR